MSDIDLTPSMFIVRTDLGAEISTSQLSGTIGAALTLLQYAAEVLAPDRLRHIEFESSSSQLSRFGLGALSGLDLDQVRELTSDLRRDIDSEIRRNSMRRFSFGLELASGSVADLYVVLSDLSRGVDDLELVLTAIAAAMNELGDALAQRGVAPGRARYSLYDQIVDLLIDSGLFNEMHSDPAGVVALSYNNPFEIVVDAQMLLGVSGSVFAGTALAVVRILFGKGPAERAEARKTNAEAERIEIENEARRTAIENVVGRPVMPIDGRVANAVTIVQQRDWTIGSDGPTRQGDTNQS